MKAHKFLVVGVGRYGSSIARKLADKGAEVYAFDLKESKIESLKDEVAMAVTLDSTDMKALQTQNVADVDAAVVSIGENFEAVMLTSVHLMDLGIKRVIARAHGPQQRSILEKLGITEVLSPEDEVADAVTEQLINPSVISFLQLPDNYEIAEIMAPRAVENRSIDDIDLRNKYQLTLVTIKREFTVEKKGETMVEQHVLGVPNSETVIHEKDTLVVFGTMKDVERFIQINE
jgi:trk system potassium uptake protein TrkA